ncbi:MAG: hypothetical protein ACLGHT_11760 [Acidimicrobiia bacterium]
MKRIAAAVLILVAACGAAEPDSAAKHDEAVLVVSFPGVGWSDVERLALPNLERFAEEAAVGHVATRLGRRSAAIDAAYLTVGAGTRAVAPAGGGGVAVEPGELLWGSPAAEVIERRVGRRPSAPAFVDVAGATERNEHSPYGATVGALGEALAEEGVIRAVIANADTALGPQDPAAYGRDAVAALMDSSGLIEAGAVDGGLLKRDREAPWGLELDRAKVLDAFARAWQARGERVVLVEASDLRRAASYGELTSPERASAMRDSALRASDEMLGGLLREVGPDTTVLVLSPVAPPGGNDLGLAAMQSGDSRRGLLRSATTRRTGYVQLADVAPTILSTLGHEVDEDAEGRPFTIQPDDRALGERVETLVTAAEQSRFRDSKLPLVVTVIITALAALTGAAVALWRYPALATTRRRSFLRMASFFALGVVPATYLVHVLEGTSRSGLAYAGAVLVVAGGVAYLAALLEGRSAGTGLVLAVGLVVGTIGLDVLTGARLQLNAVFGYSVAVAGRFAGLGNLAFALLSSATLLLAVLLAERFGRAGRVAAVGTLVAVVVVDGLPMFGADVGGVLSMVPAFGITALLLLGRRVRALDVAGLLGVAIVVLFGAAFVDAARPADSRTHLARLAGHLTDGRWDRLFDSLVRRWAASFGGGELGAWVLLGLLGFVTATYVVSLAVRARQQGTWERLAAMTVTLRAASVGLAVLAILGLVANDSSFAVPATMLIVVVPVAIERGLRRLEMPSA